MDEHGASTGLQAIFGNPNGGEETPLQGLYNDLLSCLAGAGAGGTPECTMSGFSEILNVISETINERPNTATTGDAASSSDIEPLPLTARNSKFPPTPPRVQSPIHCVPLLTPGNYSNCSSEREEETSCLESDSDMYSIIDQPLYLPVRRREWDGGDIGSESESESITPIRRSETPMSDIENFANVKDFSSSKLEDVEVGGDEAVSNEVVKALKQFGLEGLVPLTAHQRLHQDVPGDNPDNWMDRSPLDLSAAGLTRLLNSFTNGY